jgi:hypothetical protein
MIDKPAGWPLQSFDGRDWAAEFVTLHPQFKDDQDLLAAWFANALMRGYDEAAGRLLGRK